MDLAAFRLQSSNLTGDGPPVRVTAAAVTQGLGPLLGLRVPWGRWFTPEEDQPGGSQTAVLSYELARDRFGSPEAALGRDIEIDGVGREVVGVTAAGFRFPSEATLWRTLQLDYFPASRDDRELEVIGKVREGSTIELAQAELQTLTAVIARDNPDKNKGWSARADSLRSWLVPDAVRSGLTLVFGAVLLVLLIACFNVAGLLLARAGRRQGEFVVQAALGAGRRRLLTQALSETFVLALAGACLGALAASWITSLGAMWAADIIPLANLTRIDARALAFAAGLTAIVTLVTGIAPALRASRVEIAPSLRESGRNASAGLSTQRFRRALAAAQLAVSLALLVGAGLLIQSFRQLERAPLGFDAGHLLTATVAPPATAYPNQQAWTSLMRDVLERVRRAPGVVSAGMSTGLPLSQGNTSINISSPEPSALNPGETIQTYWRVVSPGYFETMRIPIVEGEAFREAIDRDSAAQVILTRAAAHALWPDEPAAGKRIRIGSDGGELRVVGVADDVRQGRLEAVAGPGIYVHYGYWAWETASFAVRTEGDPAAATAALRRAVAAHDAELPLFDVRPMSALVAGAAKQARFQSMLLTGFAAIAALLAVIGLYGVLSFMVERRRRELALRLAVGADWAAIRNLVLSSAARLCIAGVGAGLLLAWMLSRFIRHSLYEVEPGDPLVYAAVTALLALAALAAAWIPARRAARVDPAVALRHE